jgi:signal transduction histidine kinase
MKLFTKYNRINLVATIIIFLLASVAFYIAIRLILVSQVDDDLRIEQREIQTYINEHGQLPESVPVKDQKITYAVSDKFSEEKKYATIKVKETGDKETEPYRALYFYVSAGNKNYSVTVAKSLEGTDELSRSILLISSATILLILLASWIMNRVVLKKIWQPFYRSLGLLKKFRVEKDQGILFPDSSIDEFSLMNKTLQQVTRQASQDYTSLKEFTENASHEMQTPLAIIRSKLDLLIQDERLSENQSKAVGTAYDSIEKLARLNQSLLLLAKIENNQYTSTEELDFNKVIEEKLSSFRELWQAKEITISTSLAKAAVNMNKELADILLNNLLSNATKYNYAGGHIDIDLADGELSVTNSSHQKELDRKRLFSRFYKEDDTMVETGLGLSIIKQICDVSGFSVKYRFSGKQHSFIISW